MSRIYFVVISCLWLGVSYAGQGDQRLESWQLQQTMQQQSPWRGLEWHSVGPVTQGGRVVAVAPAGKTGHFYVAYASGGLWKTDNNGASFTPLTDQQASMIIGALAVDPNNSQSIWLGTGENNSSRSSYGGLGLLHSDDGGVSWQSKGLVNTDRIGRIWIDPDNSQHIVVAALGALYTHSKDRGIYQSLDGGESWKKVLFVNDETGFIDLQQKPDNPRVLYAASWQRIRKAWDFSEGGKGSAVWKSVDGGNTWQRSSHGLPQGQYVGRIGLAVSASSPDSLYAAIDNQAPLDESQWDLGDRPLSAKRLKKMTRDTFLKQDPDEIEQFIRDNDLQTDLDAEQLIQKVKDNQISMEDLINEISEANNALFNTDIRGLELYRSDDAGRSWYKTHEQPIRNVTYTYGYYFGQVRAAPENIDHVYLSGVPLIESLDGGKTFSGLNDPSVHVDHHELWLDPDLPGHLILGNDGGIDMSYDGGQHFQKMDHQAVGQIYTLALDNAKPFNIYAGFQDNGTWKGSSAKDWDKQKWKRLFGGDGMSIGVDTESNKVVYVGFQFGNQFRLEDGVKSVRPRDKLGEPALRYNWNTPVILSSHNQDIVYFGANKVFRSMNKGKKWEAISDDLSHSKKRGDVPYASITTLAESPLKFGYLWAGTDDGFVYVSPNGGANWNQVSKHFPKGQWVSRVEASSHQLERAYVSMNGYRNDIDQVWIYKTEDAGKHWKKMGKGIPDSPVNVIREDPVNENLLYVGTDRGVYFSSDRGENWQSIQGNLPNVPVHDLRVHKRDHKLVAGTHGRSAWVVDIAALQTISTEQKAPGLWLSELDDVKSKRSWRTRKSLWFEQQSPPELSYQVYAQQGGEIEVSIIDAHDCPVYKQTLTINQGINELSWNLIVNKDLALKAEEIANQDVEINNLSQTPLAEAVRLGQQLYITPGDYRLVITKSDETVTQKFSVKKPEKFDKRIEEND